MFISVHTEHASNFKDYKMKHPILNSYLSKQSKVKKKDLGDVFSYHIIQEKWPVIHVLEMSRDKWKLLWMFIYIIYVVVCYQICYPIYENYLRKIEYLNTIYTNLFYRCVQKLNKDGSEYRINWSRLSYFETDCRKVFVRWHYYPFYKLLCCTIVYRHQ